MKIRTQFMKHILNLIFVQSRLQKDMSKAKTYKKVRKNKDTDDIHEN